MFKFYEVGGKIRDEFLGLTNKDVDYVAVPTEACYSSIHPRESQPSPARLVFQALKSYLEEQKFEIFLVTPDCSELNNKTCKVGMPFLCKRVIKRGKSGFMYKDKFYSLETEYGWVF